MTSGRLLLYLIALVVVLAQARAAPLDADTCAKLEGEQEQLEGLGVEKEMAKGPAWAKANLAPEKLAQVRRFIELEELILFRCRRKSLVTLPPEPEAAAGGDQTEQDKQEKPETGNDKEAAPAAGPPAAKTKTPAPAAKPAAKQKAEADKAPAARKPAAAAKKQESGAGKRAPTKAAARQQPADGPPAEKAAAKAKVDDAYKPAPADPTINPFASQLSGPGR
jgi:hypothetical protein